MAGGYFTLVLTSRRQLLTKRVCQSSETILRVLLFSEDNPVKFRPDPVLVKCVF